MPERLRLSPVSSTVRRLVLALGLAAAGLVASLPDGWTSERSDPLAAEIDRWATFLRSNPATDELWGQIKQACEPALARTQAALRDGRRLLALARLASVQANLAAAAHAQGFSAAQRKDEAAFEAEWTRLGSALGKELEPPSPRALEGVQPAAVRAVGETALPQVRTYYEASLDYARSTEPQFGFFYIGAAQAARELTALCRTLSTPSGLAPPPLRKLDGELDELEAELLSAYRPPVSIDRHPDFIRASALLKEARELDSAGLRYGALLRYLQAAERTAELRAQAPPTDLSQVASRLAEQEKGLSAGKVDHSLGRLFVETAEEDLSGDAPERGTTAAAVVASVLPRYLAALEPAPARPPRPTPRATVTLVRWPYT
jgi:hypothetical protein